MSFPVTRMRRLRKTPALRRMFSSVNLSLHDLIYPLFVMEGKGIENPVQSMPGISQFSLDRLLVKTEEVVKAGLKSIVLFGVPESKDAVGSRAYAQDGIIQRAVSSVKREFPELVVVTDVCLCEYTDHGHCGLVESGKIQNDATLDLLAKTALTHAQAGADMVAPSDMMDGRVGAIRQVLDRAGYEDTLIMAYSAKYASAFYGPFREAAGSAPQFGDRSSYQMDPAASAEQAVMEAALDLEEGADIIMVKPALAYLDILKRVREEFLCPVACYNVSGEYAMIKAAALNGWINERKVVLELMTGLKRAGSDLILTYFALDLARWLREEEG